MKTEKSLKGTGHLLLGVRTDTGRFGTRRAEEEGKGVLGTGNVYHKFYGRMEVEEV